MSERHYCDFQGCGAALDTDGLRAKVRKGPGKLGGKALDLCGEHAVELERFLLGRPDEDRAGKPRIRALKPTRPAATVAIRPKDGTVNPSNPRGPRAG